MLGGIILFAAGLAAAAPSSCARLAQPLAAGDTPIAADLVAAPCDSARVAFVYDPASGLARARRDLFSGEIVKAPPPAMIAVVRKGQSLSLKAAVGPVAIERRVVVLRAAGKGRPVWVSGEDGAAFLTSAASVTP